MGDHPPHANEWLGLLMDWDLADSSCSLQNEGSSTLTYEGGASDYECSNTGLGLGLYDSPSCKYTYNSANIFNHTANITINTNSLLLTDNLLKSKEEDTSLSSQEFSASPSPLDATSTTFKSHYPPPHYHIDTKNQVVKETSYYSGSYNTIIKGSDIKEGQIVPHETTMMGNFPLISAGGQQAYVRSKAGNSTVMRHLTSVKSNASNTTYVPSRRSKAKDIVLEQASEMSKATANVQLGQKLVIKRDDSFLELLSGMHQEGKEPSPWPSSNHLPKCHEAHATFAKPITALNSRPHCGGKKMTISSSSPLAHPTIDHHQYSKSLTLSFNQHNNPTSKRPHKYHDHDHDDEYHNNSSLGLLFSNPNYSLIKESELDDMSGITGNDDDESFSLITEAYETRKKTKVENDSSARHCLAERKRREKLNKKFDELRAIVGPSLSVKTDKTSIIGAAVKLLNDKKVLRSPIESQVSTTKIMREEVNTSKEISHSHPHLMSKSDKSTLSNGSSLGFQVDSHPHETKPHVDFSEVFCDLEADFELGTMGSSSCNSLLHDIKVNAKQQSPQRWHYIINVRAPKRPTIFSDIITTLSKLDLQVIFANSCFSNNNTLSVTSPTMTWFLLKVEVVERFSSFDPTKCEVIHDAIRGCIIETHQQKTRDLMVEGLGS